MKDRELRDAVAMSCFNEAYKTELARGVTVRFTTDPEETASQAAVRRRDELTEHYREMAANAFAAADAFLSIWEMT